MMANWTDVETKELLKIRGEEEICRQMDGTIRSGAVYSAIAVKLAALGIERSKKQVMSKLKTLKARYYQMKKTVKSADRRYTWPYYDLCDDIWGNEVNSSTISDEILDPFDEDCESRDEDDQEEKVHFPFQEDNRDEPGPVEVAEVPKQKMSELLLNMDDAYNDLVTKRRKFQQPKYHNILVHRENLYEGFLRHESRTCVENAHHTTGKLDYCEEDEEAWLYFGPVKKTNDNSVTNITEKDRGMDVFLLAILFASQHNALETKYPPRFKTERLSNGIDGPSYNSSIEVQEAANRWPSLPRRQLQRAMGDYELLEQESRAFVDYQLLFWVASDDSFHDRRGKNFAKKVLEVLFSWHQDADIKMSTQGADQMLAIRGIVAPLPVPDQAAATPLTLTHRIKNHLPITMQTSLHDGKMSDLYVFDTKRGKVLLLGIVSNGGESLDTRKNQLMEHMLLSWRPFQTMMFGILFRPTCVYLVIFELDMQSRELRRSISPPLKYRKDGLRTVFESVLSTL